MPEFQKDLMYHTLIFIPSYFDYVRIRNWSASADLDFAEICEYTKVSSDLVDYFFALHSTSVNK